MQPRDVTVPEPTGLGPEHTFVALAEGRVVGVASFILHTGQRAETASFAVDPAWRRRGIGERLQRARLAELRALGVRHVRTEADRPEAIDFYVRKFGYKVTGTAPKKHDFSLPEVREWTVLTLEL
jgi:predicted N-acetyltransferase YhbS